MSFNFRDINTFPFKVHGCLLVYTPWIPQKAATSQIFSNLELNMVLVLQCSHWCSNGNQITVRWYSRNICGKLFLIKLLAVAESNRAQVFFPFMMRTVEHLVHYLVSGRECSSNLSRICPMCVAVFGNASSIIINSSFAYRRIRCYLLIIIVLILMFVCCLFFINFL